MSSRTGLAALAVTVPLLVPLGIERLASNPSQASGAQPTATVASAGNGAALPVIEPKLARRVGAREIARSRHAYAGVGAARAARLAQRSFPTWLSGPPQGRPKLSRGTRITRYVGDRAARIDNGKHRGLLISTLPLRVRTRSGLKPIDLRLRPVGGALAPRRPLVPARLPGRIGAGVTFSDLARLTPVTAAGREAVAARRLGATRAIYPGIAADTDFIAEPTVLGVEAYWQLRSRQSPELQILRHSLGRGVTLQPNGEAVELLRNGRPAGRILAPQAFDAAGRPVRVTQKLVGNELQLVVAHRRAGVRYPVLVDPGYVHTGVGYLTDNWYDGPSWRVGNPNGLQAWAPYTNHPVIYTGNECDPTALSSNCDDGNVLGLFISAHNGWFTSGSGAFWQYQAQGLGESSWISYLQGAWVRVSSNGGPSTTSASMYIANNSGGAIYPYAFGSNWGPGNPAVTDTGANGHGRLARFQLTMSGDGQRNTYNTMSVGGAVIEMFEASAPGLSGSPQLGWSPSEWYTGTQPITAKPTFLNTGFGVARNQWNTYKPGDWVPQTRKVRDQTLIFPQHACDGTHLHRCNYSWQTEMAIPTEQMPEGVNTVQLGAWSPSGKGSEAWGNAYTYKVDRSPPSAISVEGGLKGKENSTVPAGSYSFYVTATDCASAGTRSGIKTISVLVDGDPVPGYSGSGTLGCTAQTPTIPVTLDAGAHEIAVTATDGVGLALVKAFTVTAVDRPENVVAPKILGAGTPDETMAVDTGEWSIDGLLFTYEWRSCAVGGSCYVVGTNASTYDVQASDAGRQIYARVTGSNGADSTTVDTARTDPIQAWVATTYDYALSNPVTSTVTGTRDLAGICMFDLELTLSESGAIEQRQTAINLSACQIQLETGVPPQYVIDEHDAAPADGASAGLPETLLPYEDLTGIDLAQDAVLDAARLQGAHASGVWRRRNGYYKTIWEDKPQRDLNWVRPSVSWWYNGSCIGDSRGGHEYYWYWPSGWRVEDQNWQGSARCAWARSSSYGRFLNSTFCAGQDLRTYYSRTSVYGKADGSLQGKTRTWKDGACEGLIHFDHILRYY